MRRENKRRGYTLFNVLKYLGMTVYVDKSSISMERPICLNQEVSHYIIKVMRCKLGDCIDIIDGEGGRYVGEINGLSSRCVSVIITSCSVENEPPYNTALCQSILKGSAMDDVIREVTELGIREIYPLISERTILRETKKLQRWEKIAKEASEQSGRSYIPVLHAPHSLEEMINRFSANHSAVGLLFSRSGGDLEDLIAAHEVSKRRYLAIGPEGGFSAGEISKLLDAGFMSASLGRLTLRAQTAGPIAVALTHYFIDAHKRDFKSDIIIAKKGG